MSYLLIVNDDGYRAAGIRALQQELSKDNEVLAVAPLHEQSWMGKSISAHSELELIPKSYHGFDGYAVDATPASCTQLGMYNAADKLPDAVVSGINHGANIGHGHILSSGTVGAAFEAAENGIPAFASSQWRSRRGNPDADFNAPESAAIFTDAAAITSTVVAKVLSLGFPTGAQVIGINVPYGATLESEWVVTKPHSIAYGQVFTEQSTSRYRNVGGVELKGDEELGTDLHALSLGLVSIMPISIELTSMERRQQLADLLHISMFN